ncbi:MAG: peptidase M23 [Bacteroidota bacterium]
MKNKNLFLVAVATITSSLFVSCTSSSQKVENADANVTEAKQELAEAKSDYIAEMVIFKQETNEKIAANELVIADLKSKMSKVKKDEKAAYIEQIAVLEKKNTDLKIRMENYNEDGNDKWESFKREFNHDMDELGKSLNDLTVDNEN